MWIAALPLVAAYQGIEGVKNAYRNLLNGRNSVLWYAVAILIPPAVEIVPPAMVRMAQGYQPMHQLIVDEILATGMERGLFRQLDPGETAELLTALYLGIGSTVDKGGRSRLAPAWIAEFVLDGLRKAVD